MVVLSSVTQLAKRCLTNPCVFMALVFLAVMLMAFNVVVSSVDRHNVWVKQMRTSNNEEGTTGNQNRRHGNKKYLVLWFSMLTFIQKRPYASSADFTACEYNNCELTFNRTLATKSDAVMFEGRRLPSKIKFKRPTGQVWIYAEHEAPPVIEKLSSMNKFGVKKLRDKFNWTMTYDKVLADIHLPYGELRKHKAYVTKDYHKIAANKTKGALIITSHCDTPSQRMEFINELRKYTNVEVLGKCGKKWNCGKWLYHDNCFDILNNTYSFYLAFENALCEQYFTEKLFENFNYDILMVIRGGRPHEASSFFPKGSVIDSDAFEDPRALGKFLTNLAHDKRKYAAQLAVKSQYYSIGFREAYQRALCDVCYRLNHQDIYYKSIPDVLQVLSKKQSCRKTVF